MSDAVSYLQAAMKGETAGLSGKKVPPLMQGFGVNPLNASGAVGETGQVDNAEGGDDSGTHLFYFLILLRFTYLLIDNHCLIDSLNC